MDAVQTNWKQKKVEIERLFENVLSDMERVDPDKVKVVKRNKDEMMETIEGDLYPNREKNKGSSALIWVLVIVGIIVVVGIISYFWCRKSKRKNF